MAQIQDRLLALLKKWPVNPERVGRDFSVQIRSLIGKSRYGSNPFPGTLAANVKALNSIQKIVDNKYYLQFKSIKKIGACGIPVKELNICLNDSFIEAQNKRWIRLR
ncbi:hypothetical protein RUM44_001876 [Polyplax serrata]|uniref:Mitochondrial nucleoid factor 1 n=1 Tax=Polyplax serrata TaxID=468196 RepID=A0ABR1ALL4_POLSC